MSQYTSVLSFLPKWAVLAGLIFVAPIFPASIGIAQQDFFVFGSGSNVTLSDNSDPSYTSTLNSNNLGTFSWTYVNTTGATLTNVNVFVFLDADIDRAINGASNEYGQVISQALPPGSAANALNWSSFQIDEPGFVSGTIFNNLLNGFLDNTNHVPPGTTNDVSLALGFSVGTLLPGQETSGVFTISTSNIGGLSQTDPNSNFTFYFNGYATAPGFGTNGSGTPEPRTFLLLGIPLVAVLLSKGKKLFRSAAVLLAICGFAFTPTARAQMTLSPQATAQGFKLTQFVDGYNIGNTGPLGIAFPASGGVLVASYDGNVRLFPSDNDGQHVGDITPAQNYGFANAVGLTVASGRIYLTEQSAGLIVQLNDNGTYNQTITSLSGATGITTNPANGHIFVSGNVLLDVDPIAKTSRTFINAGFDGLTFSADGSTIYAAIYGSRIQGYRVSDGTQVFDSGPISGADGCALGTGSLSGLLFVNTNYGQVVQVDLATATQTVIASGGSRGDFVTVDPNGSLLITQSDRILRITAPSGAGFGNSTPVISNLTTRFKDASVDVSWAPPSLFSNTGTISVCYLCVNTLGIPATDDGPVFIIQNSSTSAITGAVLSITPANAPMDSFLIGTIAPGSSFQLTPGVSNDHGTGHTFFAVTGSILDTSDSGPNADTTQFRLTGSEGGNSVDTGIFTPASTRTLSNDGSSSVNFLGNEDGPCNNCFGPKVVATLSLPHAVVSSYNLYRRSASQPETRIQSGLTGTFFEDTGLTDGTIYYYTVRWVDPAGVESGDSTEMSATPTSLASRIAHNTPPTILSNPTVLATAGSAYIYQVQASDPDPGDALTYTLATAPSGMTVSSGGLISWTPLATQSGNVTAKVVVTDKKGHFASQQYQIVVQSAPPTAPPVITSNPLTNAAATQLYAYQVVATDPNTGAVLSYSLSAAPAGMSITLNSGLIQWIPNAAQVGTQNVTVMVQDQFGLSTTQSYAITVGTAPVHYPVITSAPVTTASATLPYTYQVVASDPNAGQKLTYSLPAAPAGMTINANTGLIQWSPTVPQEGAQMVTVVAMDGLGLSASQIFTIQVTAPILPPTVIITSPTPGSTVTSVTNITGSITDPNNGAAGPLTWTLAILKPGATGYQTIASGSSAVTSGTIATIDPTMLPNNTYPVLLTVKLGNYVSTTNLTVNVSGNLKLGNFSTQFTDLAIPVAGIPLSIVRRYDSLDTSTGDFGAGWRLALPGQVSDSAGGQGFTTLTHVYVTLPNGTREGFTFNPTLPSVFFPIWVPGFTPDAGVTDTLSTPGDVVFNSGGTFYDLAGPYAPTFFSLTTKYGVRYDIDEVAGLQMVTDANGNTLTVAPLGLISSTGVSLAFQRDAQNRITKITEPGSNPAVLQYSYDTNGNLSTFTDQNGNVTNYFYENAGFPNYLTRVVDPLGRPVLRNVFNSAGQFIAQCDANGNPATLSGCITYNPDSVGRTQTIFDARGFETDLVFDASGNVLTQRKWLDSTHHLDTVRTYDANGNVLSVVDPAGNKTTNTYDASGNLLTTTDPLGNVTSTTYNSCNQVLTSTDPSGNVTSNTYDSNCNLLSSKNALGAVASYKYNSFGEPTDYIDPLGSHWSWSYDSAGFLLGSTDPFGNKTIFTVGPTGDILTRIDRNGRRIDSKYDGSHRLVQETWATTPPHVITYNYDVTGQMSSASDPNSVITLTYTNLGQLSTVSTQGSSSGVPSVTVTYGYDADGNLSQVLDSLGGITAYNYDALSRLTSATQSGTQVNTKRVDFQYDDASFLTELSRSSDVLGSNQIANTFFETDCNGCPGRVTAIRHRKASNNAVIDDLAFSRDKLRDITNMSDADGSHAYSYDAARRLLTATHTNPIQPNESYTYDLAGNRTASQLSASYVYGYSSGGTGNRLMQDQQFSYQYDNEGNQVRKTNRATGAYTVYQYDFYNRLIQATQYSSAGVQTGSYQQVFDAFGRRQQVIDQGVSNWVSYAGLNPVLVLDNAGGLVARRFYLPSSDKLMAEDQGSTTYWPLLDQLGTPRDLISSSGVVVDHMTMDSFGRVLARNPSIVDSVIGFTGREKLSDGDVFMRSRQYDPQTGLFRQEDLLRPFAYSYAASNPLSYRDPSGGEELEEYAGIASEATSLICGTGLPANPSAGVGILGAQFVSGQYIPSPLGVAGFFIGRTAVTLDFLAAFLGQDNNVPLASRWQNAVSQAQSAAINPAVTSACNVIDITQRTGSPFPSTGYKAGVENGLNYLNSLQPQ